jgi:two-component system sensor histidine kinase BaeS
MKMKLAYKLFLAFLATSLISIVVMVGVMHYVITRNFEDFLNKVEAGRLNTIAQRLGEAYRQNNGWGFLSGDPGSFTRLLHLDFPGDGHDLRHPDPDRPERRPPLPGMSGKDHGPGMPPPEARRFIEQRMALFDAQKRLVAGKAVPEKDRILREIKVDGKTVGWLSLDKGGRPPNPLEERFLSRQLEGFFFTGCAVLVLAAFVSYLLSRHLLRPVGQLTKGADALASRKFDTRIEVSSGDELGQLADDFNRMAQTLERYEELRKQWISDISHELRTPIAVLRGEIEAMQDGVREMTRENIESLHAEIMLLGKLINDLHELSMAEAGVLSARQEPVDVAEVLEDTLSMFNARFSQASLAIQHIKKPEGSFIITGDSDRLAQVFSNILENTLRYTESPGRLEVRCESTGREVHVIFEDTKPGVPDESLGKLFDRLFRIDPSRSRKYGGSGLGLAICRNIVESLGGEIGAGHAGIGGLRIEIILPLSSKA